MNYTISDLYSDYRGRINQVAGTGGLSRPVSMIGILDYELVREARDRFFAPHFQEGQFVITSLLYAKDEPYLLIDAVKHLIAKGCSGLLIKNVFHLPIHDSVIRYADFNNFPIFVVTSSALFMEDLIYDVTRRIRELSSAAYVQEQLERLLARSMTAEEVEETARAICPSLVSQFYAVYVRCGDLFSDTLFARKVEELSAKGLLGPGTVLSRFRSGFLLIRSADHISSTMTDKLLSQLVGTLTEGLDWLTTGVSDFHLRIPELPQCVREAVYASVAAEEDGGFTRYRDLGLSRLLFAVEGTPAAAAYREGILSPILEYDIETGGHLLETLQAYIHSGCSMEKAAEKLSQHVNTVRYRLEKIASLTGLSYRDSGALTELTVALRLREATDRLATFGKL